MLAVLIDADNAQPSITEALLVEIANFGIASVKRIYGDWTTSHLNGWKSILLTHSIQPVQQFRYTTGKNATDSAMIIDAMDLLYTRRFNGFCLVSSDSDFTRLAARIREEGLPVYGFGERKSPPAFVSACDKFTYTEVLRAENDESSSTSQYSTNNLKGDAKLVNLIRRAVDVASDESGWARLSTVGTNIAKQSSEFDPRNYGYTKLGELVDAIQLFEIDKRRVSKNNSIVIYIRDQRKSSTLANGNKEDETVSISQWNFFLSRYSIGDKLNGVIEGINPFGLFVSIPNMKVRGLLHKSNLPEDYKTHFVVGDAISVVIRGIKDEKHQVEFLLSKQNSNCSSDCIC